MKFLFVAILVIAGIANLHAQNCNSTLSGKVVDVKTGQPLVSAKIKIADTKKITYSDIDGKFTFKNLCDKPINIEVTHPGCQEEVIPVLIDGNTYQKVSLDHHSEKLEKVVIVANSIVRKSQTSQEQSISGKDIDNFSSATMGDALRQMSGVSTIKTGKAVVKPVIQGLSGSRVPILNNGVRMEDQEWGAEHAPNVDLNSAGKLTVVKGAAALQYGGDAIGGVVIADHAKIPKKDTLYGKTILSGSTNGRGGSVSSTLTKSYKNGWYVNLQGTYKKFGDFEAPDYVLSNTGTNERDFSANFGLNKFDYGFDVYYSSFNNHLGILRASSTGSVADLVNAINSGRPSYIKDFTYDLIPPRQKVQHHLARVKFYKHFEGLGKLMVNYNFQENNRLEYDIRTGNDKYKPSLDLDLKTHSASANFDFNTHNDRQLNVGIDGSYKNNFANPETGVRRIIPDYKQYAFGAFATGHYSFNQNWLVEAGFRYDYSHINSKKYYQKIRWHNQGYDQDFPNLIIGEFGSQYLTNPVFDYSNISLTVGAKYSFNSAYDLRVNYAMSNRAPNPSELFSDGLHHSAASIELGDLRITSEHSNKVSLAFEKQTGDFTFNVAPYYNYIDNYINSEPNGLEETVRGVFLRYQYKQNNVSLLGLDVDANYKLNHNFSYHGKFSTVDGKETKTHRPLIDIPATNTTHSITYHNQWHQATLTLRGDAVFKKQDYPDNNFNIKIRENGTQVNTLVDISTPPDGYFLTGFDANAVFHPFKRGSMAVRLSLNNIFDVDYRDYLNRLRYYAANTGRNITLQVKFNY